MGTCCLQREFIGLSGPRLSDLTCNPTVSMLTRTLIGREKARPAPDWLLSVVGGAARQLNGSNNLQLSVSAVRSTTELLQVFARQGETLWLADLPGHTLCLVERQLS